MGPWLYLLLRRRTNATYQVSECVPLTVTNQRRSPVAGHSNMNMNYDCVAGYSSIRTL